MTLLIITLGIITLEAYALHLGYDGKILLTVIATLSTIAGWQLKKQQERKEKTSKKLITPLSAKPKK